MIRPMKSIETIKAGILSQAEKAEAAPAVSEETREQAKILFELLSRQDVLALIFRRGNKLGTPSLEIVLAGGIRDDQPKMKFEEEVVLGISLARKAGEVSLFSLAGRITISSDRFHETTPKFRSQSSLSHWMEMKYLGNYSAGEVLSLDADNGFEIEMVRTLNPEKLATAHGCRLEEIFKNLAEVIGLEIEEKEEVIR